MANEFKARLTIQRATPASDGGTVSRAPPCSKIRRGGENTALPPLSPFNSPCASTVPATTLPLVDLHDLHGCTPPNRTHRPGLTATPQPPHSALSGWAALPECLAQPRAWKASLRRWGSELRRAQDGAFNELHDSAPRGAPQATEGSWGRQPAALSTAPLCASPPPCSGGVPRGLTRGPALLRTAPSPPPSPAPWLGLGLGLGLRGLGLGLVANPNPNPNPSLRLGWRWRCFCRRQPGGRGGRGGG